MERHFNLQLPPAEQRRFTRTITQRRPSLLLCVFLLADFSSWETIPIKVTTVDTMGL